MPYINESNLTLIRRSNCMSCGNYPSQAHHIMTKGMGGANRCDHFINLAPLCVKCHTMLHSSPKQFQLLHGKGLYNYLIDTDNNIRHLYNSGYLGD